MSIEAMKLAIDAAKNDDFERVIKLLEKAIAEAEKRERNFCERCGKRLGKNDWDVHTCTPPASEKQEPDDLTIAYMSGVYEGKKMRQWVGLTDEEIENIDYKCGRPLARAVEAKLKEKNT